MGDEEEVRRGGGGFGGVCVCAREGVRPWLMLFIAPLKTLRWKGREMGKVCQ